MKAAAARFVGDVLSATAVMCDSTISGGGICRSTSSSSSATKQQKLIDDLFAICGDGTDKKNSVVNVRGFSRLLQQSDGGDDDDDDDDKGLDTNLNVCKVNFYDVAEKLLLSVNVEVQN